MNGANVRLYVYLPPELDRWLRARAARNGLSTSRMVRLLVAWYRTCVEEETGL